MWLVTLGILLAGGILGAASLIVAKKPNAQQLIDKLTPYQGWIGAVMFLWGIWDLISTFRAMGLMALGVKFLLLWIIILVASLTELLLGFLLGFGLITQYALSKNEQAMAKGQAMRAKLAPFQGLLGILAIVVALLFLVLRIIL